MLEITVFVYAAVLHHMKMLPLIVMVQCGQADSITIARKLQWTGLLQRIPDMTAQDWLPTV